MLPYGWQPQEQSENPPDMGTVLLRHHGDDPDPLESPLSHNPLLSLSEGHRRGCHDPILAIFSIPLGERAEGPDTPPTGGAAVPQLIRGGFDGGFRHGF